jgi:hypothetical protein
LGGECVDGAARGELSGSPAKLLLDSTSTSRFRAARPVTFFVLPKKVTKERRAYKDAACGGALRYSDEPAGVETRTISALRAEPRASNSRRPTTPARPALLCVFGGIETLPARRAVDFEAPEDAEQRSAGRGIWPSTVRSTWLAPQARDRASFDGHRTARAAQGTGEAGAFAGASFFAYFLWQDKESRGPRGPEVRPGRKTISPARSASNPIAPGERSARAPAC